MERPPKKQPGDKVFDVVQAAASAMPVAGPAVAAVMGLIGPKIAHRRDKWFELLADKISELESRVDGFAEDPMFITAVFEATSAALKTHEQEKLEALRNAVGNSVLPGAPEDSIQLMYLRFLDELSAAHLKVLDVLNNPRAALARAGKELRASGPVLAHLIYLCLPDLNGEGFLVEQVHRDLRNRGLIDQGAPFGQIIITAGTLNKSTTLFGEQFLQFIRR
jgi:hypothetical protein